MKKVELGNTGIKVSQLGLGCMGMSEFYGKTDEEESMKVLNISLDAGINFLDTADSYGAGENEQLLSKILKTRRKDIFLCTKFGLVRGEDKSWKGVCGKPEYVKQACEASLKRLGIDYIDLYYLHRVDPKTPIEDTVRAMAELVKEGKVKYIGLSEVSASDLRKAHAIHPITALQSEYSLWSLDVENEILQNCRELKISFVAYSPLGRGFLTGQIKKFEDLATDDLRRSYPRFQPENFDKNMELVHKLEEIAQKKGCTSSQLALAWVLAQGDDIIAIPGTKQVKYQQQNMEALNVKLTREEVEQIGNLGRSIEIKGTRTMAWGMKLLSS